MSDVRAENEHLRDVLRQVQWSSGGYDAETDYGVRMCPLCDQTEARGHSPDCLIGAALEAAHA